MNNPKTRLTWYFDAVGLGALVSSALLLVATFLVQPLSTVGLLFALFFPVFAFAVLCLLGVRLTEIAAVLRSNKEKPTDLDKAPTTVGWTNPERPDRA